MATAHDGWQRMKNWITRTFAHKREQKNENERNATKKCSPGKCWVKNAADLGFLLDWGLGVKITLVRRRQHSCLWYQIYGQQIELNIPFCAFGSTAYFPCLALFMLLFAGLWEGMV